MTERRAVVLAGGQSRRMGFDKASVRVDGETQLERSCRLAATVAGQVFVSVRDPAAADALRQRFRLIGDAPDAEGPLAGIVAALRSAPDAEWLVLACDLPRLDQATLQALARASDADVDSVALAIESERDPGLPEPMCAIWRAPMIETIERQVVAGKFCARRCLLVAGARLVAPVTAQALDNMNTPEDLERLSASAEVAQ